MSSNEGNFVFSNQSYNTAFRKSFTLKIKCFTSLLGMMDLPTVCGPDSLGGKLKSTTPNGHLAQTWVESTIAS